MVSIVQSMARLAHLTFNNVNKCQSEEVFNESLNKLIKIMSQLSHKDINLNKELMSESNNSLPSLSLFESKRAPVSYVSIYETQHFHMCVFGLKHNSIIPLHDHPDMYGLIKVIFGSVTLSHYTPLPRDSTYILPKEVSKKISKWQTNLLVPTVHNGNTTIDSKTQDVCVLTPNERNIHSVQSMGGSAAILDILSPPYREDRECHYYKMIATVFDKQLQRDITWLLEEVDAPKDYWCDSLPYLGPNISQIDLL